MGAVVHTRRGLIHKNGRFSRLFGVQHLPERRDLAPEIVVVGHLALDLVAPVKDGRVVPSTQRLPDP